MTKEEYYDETLRQIDLLRKMIDMGYKRIFIEEEIRKLIWKRHGNKEEVKDEL
jgi:hypothetical protein